MKKNNIIYKNYISRINCVLDYIEKNLDKNFTLDELAKVANFSKFHFHRIFYSIIGETLFNFIQRIRLEKAASFLLTQINKPITTIALECGFSDSSIFSKSFKKFFKISPSDFRNNNNKNQLNSNRKQMISNYKKDFSLSPVYNAEYINNIQIWRIKMNEKNIKVEVKEVNEINVIYVRHIGPYKGDAKLFEKLFNKLFQWAGARGLINFPETKCIIIYHDDPEITEENKLRTSICITTPKETQIDGEIGKLTIPKGKYAITRFTLGSDEFQEAWNWIYGKWLPQSGYEPDDRPCFELYPEEKKKNGKFIVDIYVPVKPAI